MEGSFVTRAVDPVELEIISHELQSIPDQVEADLTRTAFSPLIYEYKDFAVALVDAGGRSIALARQGSPGFVVNLVGLGAREAVDIYGDRLAPGDVLITNHSAVVGHHLNDVVMCAPVFDGSKLVAFMGIIAHWIDIGGRYPQSCSGTDTTEIFQEGLRFRSIRLRHAGAPVEEIYRIIEANSRMPEALIGDIEAQLAGCLKGCELFSGLLARHGAGKLFAAIGEIRERTAEKAQAAVAAIPDGTYRHRCFLDNDGLDLDSPIPVDIAVHVSGSTFTVDYSEISPQVRGPFNSGRYGGGEACARMAFKYLISPMDHSNEGSFTPLRVILPDGKIVSAGEQAPMGRYSVPLPTIVDAIVGAMADVLPDRCAAGHHASFGSYGFFGQNPANGRFFVYFDTVHGGWGGSAQADGIGPCKTMIHGDNRDIPIEVQERLFPVQIESYRWRRDSAGAGRHRGGLGTEKSYIVKAPCAAQFAFDRFRCPPWGLRGGEPGVPGRVEVERQGQARELRLKESELPLQPGDKMHILGGGGGGYGTALERDTRAVASDVAQGYVSIECAKAAYGVICNAEGVIDDAATRTLRAAMAAGKS
jgi:N-methylhydantoinase B